MGWKGRDADAGRAFLEGEGRIKSGDWEHGRPILNPRDERRIVKCDSKSSVACIPARMVPVVARRTPLS
jgi:hypothetical protein